MNSADRQLIAYAAFNGDSIRNACVHGTMQRAEQASLDEGASLFVIHKCAYGTQIVWFLQLSEELNGMLTTKQVSEHAGSLQ